MSLTLELGRSQGVLKFFDETKGFGFCKREGLQDVFIHANALRRSGIMDGVKAGDTLEFDVQQEEGKAGPKGANIKILARATA